MFARLFVVSALAIALAGPALANQCPMLMTEIDAALQTADLSDADKARVEELRQQGEEAHEAGDHAASEEALNEAKDILGI